MEKPGKKLPNALVGVAGVHFVVSQLTLRGLIALPTTRNTAGIDVLVSEPDGRSQAVLQVKTSQRKVGYWPTPAPEKCLRGPHSFFVFVRYLPKEKRFEAFLANGDAVAKQVNENRKAYEHRGGTRFAWWKLPAADDAEELRRKWEVWRPQKT